jgi:hypothetical protein
MMQYALRHFQAYPRLSLNYDEFFATVRMMHSIVQIMLNYFDRLDCLSGISDDEQPNN